MLKCYKVPYMDLPQNPCITDRALETHTPIWCFVIHACVCYGCGACACRFFSDLDVPVETFNIKFESTQKKQQ